MAKTTVKTTEQIIAEKQLTMDEIEFVIETTARFTGPELTQAQQHAGLMYNVLDCLRVHHQKEFQLAHQAAINAERALYESCKRVRFLDGKTNGR
jgi:hypothetical protein